MADVLGLLGAEHYWMLVMPGAPVPKERPRVTKDGRAYTPRRTSSYELELAWEMSATVSPEQRRLKGRVALAAYFFVPDCRKRDGDNLIKTVKDAMQKAAIVDDDSQIKAGFYWVEVDRERPRVEVAWGEI